MADRKSKLQRKLNGRYIAWKSANALVAAAPPLRRTLSFFGHARSSVDIPNVDILRSQVDFHDPFTQDQQDFIRQDCAEDDKGRFLSAPEKDYEKGDVSIPVRYALVPDACFYAHTGSIAHLPSGSIISDAPERPNWNHDKVRFSFTNSTAKEEIAIPVRRYTNYSHFFLDCAAPLLRFCVEHAEELHRCGLYIVTGQKNFAATFLEKMADHFGIPLYHLPRNARLSATKTLHFDVEAPCSTWACITPDLAEVFRKVILPAGNTSSPCRKVYLHREGASWRNLTNASEVREIMEAAGFETFIPSEYNFLEQVRLMSESTHIASAHGAALTNMLFMPTGGHVFEFFPEDFAISCYLAEAAFLGHGHSPIRGVNEGARQNYRLPVEQLTAVLREAGLSS